ncbi:MAG: GDYXXLXY domain-containing protein [Proteocatella sp.]
MLNKKNKLILFIVLSIIALVAILLPGIKYELASQLGTPYKIKIQGYDPYDPVRGKYIQFTIDTSGIKTTEKLDTAQSRVCYITLSLAADDFYIMNQAFLKKPSDEPYLKSFMREDYNGGYYYDTPFSSYFISEDISARADSLLNQNFDDAYIIVKVWRGTNVITGMYIDGEAIEKLAAA